MALEASIVQRLQELRRWQVEQQERLLQHQQEQRETLSREQIRMYQALGLTVPNVSTDENRSDSVFQDSLEDGARGDVPGKHGGHLKLAIEDLDYARHLSPQKRHELLHDSGHGFAIGEPNGSRESHYTLPNSTLQDLPEQQLPGTSQTAHSSACIEAELIELPRDNSENIVQSDKSNAIDNLKDDRNDGFILKSHIILPELLVDGVEPLPLDIPINKSLIIDDIPVPSPKKDFHTLLEERLRESQLTGGDRGPASGPKQPVKRPFLKKGQGLARFKLGGIAEKSLRQIRPRTMSLPSTVRMENRKNVKTNPDATSEISKIAKKAANKTERAPKKCLPVPSRPQTRLSLKNVQPPIRVRSKSLCSQQDPRTQPNNLVEQIDRFSISDVESKTKRELEEVRIFELLEEKAENSSFCSTSSTVVALLQQSIQSTPLKAKNLSQNKLSILGKNMQSENEDDMLLTEIVYATQSNATRNNSSMTFKNQYQNDFQNLQHGKAAAPDNKVSYQFENDQVSYDNSTEDICVLPYGTDIDPNYGTDYTRTDKAHYIIDNNFEAQVNLEKNTSLHVRFSEHNEYKTIGLTDTSTISTDSQIPKHYSDRGAWSDCSVTTDSSDAEELSSMTENDRIRHLESKQDFENTCEAKKPKQMNAEDERRRYYHGQLQKEIIGHHCTVQHSDGNASDSEIEFEDKRYNYDGQAVYDVAEQTDKDDSSGADDEVSALADSTLVEEELNAAQTQTQKEDGFVFKSELLKTRLLELEREIEIFRRENIAVSTLKEKLQEERRVLERNFKEKESQFEERKQKLDSTLQEERKRLVKEKAALENRMKDAHLKAQQNKQERQEVQSLREQLEELREEINQKESRWNAAQARHRSQVRILQTENSQLKQDIQKLQNTRKNKTKPRHYTKHIVSSNTKAIHEINKHLEFQKQLHRKQDSASDEEDLLMQPIMDAMQLNEHANDQEGCAKINSDGSRMIIYDKTQRELKNGMTRKRDLYENLLKDATMGLKEGEEATKKAVKSLGNQNNSPKSNEQLQSSESQIVDTVNPDDNNEASEGTSTDPRGNVLTSTDKLIPEQNSIVSKYRDNAYESHTNQDNPLENDVSSAQSTLSRHVRCAPQSKQSTNSRNNGMVDKQGIKEVQHSDGRVEYWYPNGNVKKISADGAVTKLIYYNGDVCENRKDGSVKYFYATTRTWHTTMSDGLEILEFPDGQVERRSKDGTVEVSFPDGSVRILQSNGTEKWALPDGTLAEMFGDGEKVLILPNGQREVHTKDHKRREYPDGTVKLVYPDGAQETRYAGGRVRLKDKDGKLLMDSHHR